MLQEGTHGSVLLVLQELLILSKLCSFIEITILSTFLIRKRKRIYFSQGFQPRWLKVYGRRVPSAGGQAWLSAVMLTLCDLSDCLGGAQILRPPCLPTSTALTCLSTQ